MRPEFNTHKRLLTAATGTLLGTALFVGASAADNALATTQPVAAAVKDNTLRFGEPLVVSGRANPRRAGQLVTLEFRASHGSWRAVRHARTDRTGRYRFTTRVRSSGAVRVALSPRATVGATGTRGAVAAVRRSATRGVSVSAAAITAGRTLDVLAGGHGSVRGVLRPGRAGRVVTLERYAHRHWLQISRAHTGGGGRFALRTRTLDNLGSAPVRVRFGGDATNAGTARRVGRLSVYRKTRASWYGFGGGVACGGLGGARFGVAHKSLPCGSHVMLHYRGHTVRATVVDRGPYVGGRTWDLRPDTKAALHFGDVGTIWSTA